MNTTSNSRPFAAWSVISDSMSASDWYAVLVGDEGRLLEQPVERVLRREVVVAGRDLAQLEEVRPALLALLGPVGEHRPIARALEDVVEQLRERQHADARPEPAQQRDELARSPPALGRASSGISPSAAALEPEPVRHAFAGHEGANHPDRLVADRPRRHVDDPLEADRVGVGSQDAQVREGVLDLAPRVEPRPADDLVADAVAEARLLDRPRLGVRPVEHRDVAQRGRVGAVVGPPRQRRAARARQLLDPPGDPLGLLLLVVRLEPLDQPAAVVLRPELLVRPCHVLRHDRVGGVEDQLGRAVVLLELDRPSRPASRARSRGCCGCRRRASRRSTGRRRRRRRGCGASPRAP